MHDQANDLRQLAGHFVVPDAPAAGRPPGFVVVGGGKGGVGVTTVAVNLAVALAQTRRRIVLMDADPHGGGVALLCGLDERHTLADVLAGRQTVERVLQPGPGGVQVLPGVWGLERLSDFPPIAGQRLLADLQRLGARADLVVIDAGSGTNRLLRPFYRAAHLTLVVATTEPSAVIDTYAAIKLLTIAEKAGPIHCLVNMAADAEAGRDTQERLAQACRRFLGIELQAAGHVSADPAIAAAGRAAQPFVASTPGCDAAQHLHRLAETLLGTLPSHNPSPHRRNSSSSARMRPITGWLCR